MSLQNLRNSLVAAAAIGGVGCGLRLLSCLLALGFDLSSGLKPGGAWPAAGNAMAVKIKAAPATTPYRVGVRLNIESSLVRSPAPDPAIARNGERLGGLLGG